MILVAMSPDHKSGDQTASRATVSVSGPTSVSVSANTNTLGPKECAGCRKRITERFLLKALDLFWHEDCLKCGCCDCRLGEVGSTLYTKADLILCKRDYLRLFGTTGYCAACNKVIPAFEMVMRAKSNVYHLECFACQQCNHRFCVGDRFYLCDNKILCEYDYEERLVFANMAYNPSSLAHIRRQVNNLQPGGDLQIADHHRTSGSTTTTLLTSPSCYSEKNLGPVGGLQRPPSSSSSSNITNNHNQRDDGSSGYGSPDSETFDPPQ